MGTVSNRTRLIRDASLGNHRGQSFSAAGAIGSPKDEDRGNGGQDSKRRCSPVPLCGPHAPV